MSHGNSGEIETANKKNQLRIPVSEGPVSFNRLSVVPTERLSVMHCAGAGAVREGEEMDVGTRPPPYNLLRDL